MKRRRRVPRDVAARGRWERSRDERMARSIASGLGTRPREWWEFESDRPDLAGDEGSDVYAHLDAAAVERAAERLRHLATCGELTDSEVDAIHRGAATEREPGRYAWRSRVLRNLR